MSSRSAICKAILPRATRWAGWGSTSCATWRRLGLPIRDAAWPDFLIDLARLEWEFDQVFDGPGVEGQSLLDAEQLQSILPDRWPVARLVPVPCLRLLQLRYPVHEYYRALKRNEEMPRRCHGRRGWRSRAEITWCAISLLPKHSSRCWRRSCRGATIGETLELLARDAADLDAFAGELHAWFRFWTCEGFFLRIDLD